MEKTWEYNRIIIEFNHNQELIDIMNQHGSEGWEAFSYNEIKASKFGEKNLCIVLLKKEKSCTKEKQL